MSSPCVCHEAARGEGREDASPHQRRILEVAPDEPDDDPAGPPQGVLAPLLLEEGTSVPVGVLHAPVELEQHPSPLDAEVGAEAATLHPDLVLRIELETETPHDVARHALTDRLDPTVRLREDGAHRADPRSTGECTDRDVEIP